MANSSISPLIITMVVLILFSCFISTSFSLRAISDHKPNKKPLGFTTRVIHRDSPESPFYDPKLTDADRLRNAIQRSFDRYSHYTSNIMEPNDMRAPVSYRTFEYVISHHIGTPPVPTYSIIDTGSDLTWIQCRPCENCYDQEIPIYDPRKSTSYAKIGCEDDICKTQYNTKCDTDGTSCRYKQEYADSGETQGILSSETFIFLDNNLSGNISIPSFPFGCGNNNNFSYIKGSRLGAPGLIGLNKEPLSWIYQLSFDTFSHCFVPMNWKNTSLLRFGLDAIITSDTTPMVEHGKFTTGSYYVTMEGISVGKTRLDIPYGAFDITPNGEGGVIIDTGSATTHIVKLAHDPLIAELAKQIKLERAAPVGRLVLCYKGNMRTHVLSMPDITFHFTGMDFYIQKSNAWLDAGNGKICLSFIQALYGATMIGARHLQNVNVGYDLRKKVISFQNEDCTQT
ncbi:hypothetical protein MKW94_027918 [Papaver nudicaule]|uniref:Peptidase A1 domain-containing protein n=1 Tax=Papaver nudicaule TaxID=74823 RepID=A0AA41VD83_PAPNU|nr:hypothetical protein [Papaver nudicaule]